MNPSAIADKVRDAVWESANTGKRVVVQADTLADMALAVAFGHDDLYLFGSDIPPNHRKTDEGTEVEGYKAMVSTPGAKPMAWSLLIRATGQTVAPL